MVCAGAGLCAVLDGHGHLRRPELLSSRHIGDVAVELEEAAEGTGRELPVTLIVAISITISNDQYALRAVEKCQICCMSPSKRRWKWLRTIR
jgi:hypothetical protein